MKNAVFYWLPVILWMGIISVGSSIPANRLPEMPSADWLFWAHRSAHIIEYSMLGVLWMRAYSHGKMGITVKMLLFLAVAIFAFGCFDEWHQSFTPGRTPQVLDAIFDTICGTTGMVMYRLWRKKTD